MTNAEATNVTKIPRKPKVPEGETSAQKFKRLMDWSMTKLLARGDEVIARMKYEHTPEQAKSVVDELFNLARRVQAASEKPKKHSKFEV